MRLALRELKRRSSREERGLVLLEGARLVGDALAAGAQFDLAAFATDRPERHQELLDALRTHGVPVYSASHRDIEAVTETEHSQGILAVAQYRVPGLESLFADAMPPLVTVLENVADPGNLGTILRTSDWFGTNGVIVTRDSVDPTNPKVIRASMGSLFRIDVASSGSVRDAVTAARERGYSIVGTSGRNGADVRGFAWPERTMLLFGSEANGLDAGTLEDCDHVVTIPSRGSAESLNLAIAHAIILSHWRATA